MFNGKTIHFVVIVDNANNTTPDLGVRIWHHQNFVNGLLENKTCLIGRKTYELTQWKGKKSWVLTKNKDWKKTGIGTIHSLDDIHLFTEDDDIYILGGNSLYDQLEIFVDVLHLYIINNLKGTDPWIDFDMRKWKATDYLSTDIWSYGKLEKIKRGRRGKKIFDT
jgi:dihydrofolate reductase